MSAIDTFLQMVHDSDNIVFFGGAGVSTESGIPVKTDSITSTTNIPLKRCSPIRFTNSIQTSSIGSTGIKS